MTRLHVPVAGDDLERSIRFPSLRFAAEPSMGPMIAAIEPAPAPTAGRASKSRE